MVNLSERLAQVKSRIDQAARACGRDAGDVRLLPVSKTHPASALREAIAAGCRDFGENRVQELEAKRAELSGEPIHWTLIGNLQSNKARKAAEVADEFQALSSIKVAGALNKRLGELGRSMDVLIEVNTSGEATKFGLAPDQVAKFAASLADFEHLNVLGLMTVASPGPDMAVVAGCFETLCDLQTRLRDAHILGSSWDQLSMGMSGDFELAIAHGSTCVRIGTAIFGARNYA